MSKLIDFTGKKIGRLTVIERAEDYIQPNGRRRTMWKCKCDCGNEINIRSECLQRKCTLSCGCYRKDITIQRSKKYNKYEICGNCVTMYTIKGEPFDVDLEDFWRVKDYCWHKDSHGYLVTHEKNKRIVLHRLIMNCPNNMEVDHTHHDITDNRKRELKIVTRSQNNMNHGLKSNNTSGVTGVSLYKRTGKWTAGIHINKKHIHLGCFDDFDDAVKARKEAEKKYFGEYRYHADVTF